MTGKVYLTCDTDYSYARTAVFLHPPENVKDKLKSFQRQDQRLYQTLPIFSENTGPADVSPEDPQAALMLTCANEQKNQDISFSNAICQGQTHTPGPVPGRGKNLITT